MKIFGISMSTILLFLAIWFVARRFGGAIPLLNKLG